MTTPSVSQFLTDTLKNTTDWLKFAETKNGALIGANIAIIVASQKLTQDLPWLKYPAHFAFAFCIISCVICVSSFIPHIGFPISSPPAPLSDDDNLSFYGDVRKYSTIDYQSKLACLYGTAKLSRIESWQAEQVVVLSRLTMKKFRIFKVACWFTISAIASPVIATLIYLSREQHS